MAHETGVRFHDGPAWVDTRDTGFTIVSDHDGVIHMVDNLPPEQSAALPWLLRFLADRLERGQ